MIKVLLLCLCMVTCNDNDKGDSIIPSKQEPEIGVSPDYTELLNKTTSVPYEYNQESALKGSVVQIDYAPPKLRGRKWGNAQEYCLRLFYRMITRKYLPNTIMYLFRTRSWRNKRQLLSFKMKIGCYVNCWIT